MEVKRQLNIFELIDGEEKYFNDLELVRKVRSLPFFLLLDKRATEDSCALLT